MYLRYCNGGHLFEKILVAQSIDFLLVQISFRCNWFTFFASVSMSASIPLMHLMSLVSAVFQWQKKNIKGIDADITKILLKSPSMPRPKQKNRLWDRCHGIRYLIFASRIENSFQTVAQGLFWVHDILFTLQNAVIKVYFNLG